MIEGPIQSTTPSTQTPYNPGILGLFSSIAAHMSVYETREEQLELARSIQYAFKAKKTGIFEAGTGIGKSLAALVPAALSSKKVVVSTATISLQEQYINKDLPLLQAAMPAKLEIALLKGRNNYVGLRRFQEHLIGDFVDDEIRDWVETTETGDIKELQFLPPYETWSEINSNSDDCLRHKCPNFQKCFYYGARRLAENADILVVNHSLLLADAASYGKILPQYDLLIVDEAHHLRDIATETFSSSISSRGIKRLASMARKKVQAPIHLVDMVERDAADLFNFLDNQMGFKKLKLKEPLVEAEPLLASLTDLRNWLDEQTFDDLLDVEQAREAARLKANQLISIVDGYCHCLQLLIDPSLDWVVWAERVNGMGAARVKVVAAPLDVAPFIEDRLLGKNGLDSVVFMSATLATQGEDPFRYFKGSVGISGPVVQESFKSPFDYPIQSMLYLPNGLPNPNTADFLPQAASHIQEILDVSDGRAFVLFTSRYALNTIYDSIAHRLPFEARKQGDMPRNKLIDWFKSTPNAVLFGTSSFWEGVSVDGDQLSCVIMDRIPFQVPDDPVHEARCEQMKADSEKNWFQDLALPHAITRLKQGSGRLIRTQTDRGAVAILDPRLTEKFYGKQVLRCLPPMTVTRSLKDLNRFFARTNSSTVS